MIKPEEDREKDCERECSEDLPDAEIPKINEPVALVIGGHEGDAGRENLEVDLGHAPNMDEAGKEDECQGSPVVLEEDTDPVAEKGACAERAGEIGEHEHEEGDNDGEVEWSIIAEAGQNLDTLLKVNKGDVESEDVTGEPSDPAKPIARVCDGEDPVEYEGPSATVRKLL